MSSGKYFEVKVDFYFRLFALSFFFFFARFVQLLFFFDCMLVSSLPPCRPSLLVFFPNLSDVGRLATLLENLLCGHVCLE